MKYLKSYNINAFEQCVELTWVDTRSKDKIVRLLDGQTEIFKNEEIEEYEIKEKIYDYEKAKRIISFEEERFKS